MKRSWFFAIALLSAHALFADVAPPIIDSIEPRSGPVSGGTEITIQGHNLQAPFLCVGLPCPPWVDFGNVSANADPERSSNTQIIVRAPAHSAGTVDLTIHVPGRDSITVPQAFTYVDPIESMWEPVLLPVYIDGTRAGVGSSRWRTDLWIENGGHDDLLFTLPACTCGAVFPQTKVIPPGGSQHNLPPEFGVFSVPGRILYLNRAAAGRAFLNLRVVDEASTAVDAGTEVPVIRERNLLTAATVLQNVPLLNSRLLLRVYDVALTSPQFRVRVFAQGEGLAAIIDTTVTGVTADAGELHVTPAYAEFPIMFFGPIRAPDAVRIEVTPLTTGSRYWAFVSATNNTTNHVTLVTPQ